MVLANRRASGVDGPPWVRFIALCPEKGIALVDTGSPEAAVAPLEDFLSRTGFAALQAGALPIVPVAVGAGEVDAVADMLDAALEPTQSMIGNPNWCEGAVELLLTAPDLMLAPLRPVAPAAEVRRAAPARPSHAVEFQGKPLWRSGTLRPDSALIDWPPPRRGWLLAAAASLLLAAVGATAVRDSRAPPFYAAAPRPPAVTASHPTVNVWPRATPLPRMAKTSPATIPAPSAPALPTLTPTPAPPPLQTVVTLQPKPVAPASHATADKPPRAALEPRIAPTWPRTAAPASAAPQNFMAAGDPALNRGGGTDAAAYDRGATTVANAGLTAFVAPGTRDDDLIPANLGTAHLASGTTATLDFYGDGLVNIAISGQALARAIDPSTGKPLGSAVGKTGALTTDRGTVLVTANVAANVVDDVINTSGVIQARSASEQSGQIVLDSGSGGTVQVAGTQGTSDTWSGETAFVGGGPPGQGMVYATTTVPVAQDATVKANAITASVGGAVADASMNATHLGGAVDAVNSALANSMTSLTKQVTSLAPAVR